MPPPALVDNVRNLIVSHFGHDDASFRRTAEAIIRELGVENDPGAVRSLRTALSKANGVSRPSASTAPPVLGVLPRPSTGLLTLVDPPPRQVLFFDTETQRALDRVILEHRHNSRLAEAGLRPKSRLLFWGPPGCGKTASASWIANELSLPLGVVRLGSLITSFVGETGANLQRVLASANQTPMVLLLDEADAVAKTRDDANDVGELRRVVNALLQGLDAFMPKRSIVIMASNHSHLFDVAFWRRFDEIVRFSLPQNAQRLALLRHLTSGLKLTGQLATVARQLNGYSFAEIERAVNEVTKTKVLSDQSTVKCASITAESRAWRTKVAMARATGKRAK